jgi:hypothetical protein
MKQYKVWIQIEEIDEARDHYRNMEWPYVAGCFKNERAAREFVENELMTTQLSGSAADLLGACKVLTSYTSDLLRQLDNQVVLSDIEEIQQAEDAITRYRPLEMAPGQFQVTLQEQAPVSEPNALILQLLAQDGQLWIRPHGYGEKCAPEGQGSPVGMEIWEDRLRIVIFDNINSEEPKIIDLEKAKESCRTTSAE